MSRWGAATTEVRVGEEEMFCQDVFTSGGRFTLLVLGSFCLFQVAAAGNQVETQKQEEREDSVSRSEELTAEREARAAVVEPYKIGKLAKVFYTLESKGSDQFLSFQVNHLRLGLGKNSQNSGLAPVAILEWPRIENTPLTFTVGGSYSFRGYQLYAARFGVFNKTAPYDFMGAGFLGAPFDSDQRSQEPLERFIYADLGYRVAPQEEFFGIGPDSNLDDRKTYHYETGTVSLVTGYQPFRWFALEGRAGYLPTHIGQGETDLLPEQGNGSVGTTLAGLDHQPEFRYLDTAAYFGWEYDPNLPSAKLGVRWARFDDIGGSHYQFNRFSFDARGFLPLGSRQRKIAVRLYTHRDYADEGCDVPFYLMKTLGGNVTLRGFTDFRFRDKNLLYLSTEYRWEPTAVIDLALFYDTGKVFPDRSGFNFEHMRHSFGFGIRAKNFRRVVFRFDVGRSDEGTYVHFAFGPSF